MGLKEKLLAMKIKFTYFFRLLCSKMKRLNERVLARYKADDATGAVRFLGGADKWR